MLAGQSAHPLWDWPQDSIVTAIATETSDEVDDVRVDNDRGGRAFIQAKHRLQLSGSQSSPLAKAINQFVAQSTSTSPSDRLVLATSGESSAPILADLPRVLTRIRSLGASAAVTDAPRNQRESDVLGVVLRHVSRLWTERFRVPPTGAELRLLLTKLYVTKLELYADQSESVSAQTMLRATLQDPANAAVAWRTLISLCSEQATLQAGVSEQTLKLLLAGLGIHIGPSGSFRDDLDRLATVSADVRQRLSQLRTIRGDGGVPIRIDRPLVEELRAASVSGSVIVTGEPGSGKSGALADVMDLLRTGPDSADVVALSADALASESLGELRVELGLDHDLIDTLAQWDGPTAAYLFIDALDAGRASKTQDMLIDLITGTIARAGRWKVVASMRRFDLRYGLRIQDVFRGQRATSSDAYQLDEFATIRHFYVPDLVEIEYSSTASASPRLAEAIASASSDLAALLGNAFCLRLFADLIADGLPIEALGGIETRIQLLDAYWNRRVLDPPSSSDRRELLLREVCALLMRSNSLTAERSDLVTEANSIALAEMLAAEVLIEAPEGGAIRRDLIAFSHHVLFDYAIARLLLRGSGDRVARVISTQPETILLIRPSFQMHFEYLWHRDADRTIYWRDALRLCGSTELPEIAKVIAPAVAVRAARTLSDLAPLLRSVSANEEGALGCLHHLIGAALEGTLGASIPLERRELWARFMASLAEQTRDDLVGPIRALILEFISGDLPLSPDLADPVGTAARTLLQAVWDSDNRNRLVLHVAIRGVAATFRASPTESETLLREIITPERMGDHAFLEMPSLTDEVLLIASSRPEFARDIYVAAFEFEEESQDQTVMYSGILGMTSNRRQDYETSHYNLSQSFPTFLNRNSTCAIEALARIWLKYSKRYGAGVHLIEMPWTDGVVQAIDDHSFWANDEDHHDAEASMLTAFRSWLTDVSSNQPETRYSMAIQVLKTIAAPAGLWRAVIHAAGPLSTTAISQLTPAITSRATLLSHGLSQPIGEFLKLRFMDLDLETRTAVEHAIWALPSGLEDWDAERAVFIRDRLLGCLNPDVLTTEVARSRLSELLSTDSLPENQPHTIEFESSTYTDEEGLIDQGIDPREATVASSLAAMRPLEEFAATFVNSSPTPEAIRGIVNDIARVLAELTADPEPPVPQPIEDRSWIALAQAAQTAARASEFASLASETVSLIESSLLACSNRPVREPSRNLAEFDRSPSWSQSPKQTSADGLLCLAHHGVASGLVKARIRALTSDPAPEVRLAVLSRVRLLQSADPELMWEILENGRSDESGAVIAASVGAMSAILFWTEPDRLLDLLRSVFVQAGALGERAMVARKPCIKTATELYIRRGHVPALDLLGHVIDRIAQEPEACAAIGSSFRRGFSSAGDDSAAIRERAFALAIRLTNAATAQLDRIRADIAAASTPVADEHAKSVAQMLDRIATDYYFASGAYERTTPSDDGSPAPDSSSYYQASVGLVEALHRAPFPRIIHHLLQTLAHFMDERPEEVFPLISRTIDAGRAGGYEFDPMAASLAVSIAQRFIAEYRTILLNYPSCRSSLIRILDIFVAAGWAEARKLTYDLETIFR